jgi:hypothetical protein
VVREAELGEPQIVTRRGVETAVVISHDEFERLRDGRVAAHGTLGAALLAMPSSDETSEFERIELVPREIEG